MAFAMILAVAAVVIAAIAIVCAVGACAVAGQLQERMANLEGRMAMAEHQGDRTAREVHACAVQLGAAPSSPVTTVTH